MRYIHIVHFDTKAFDAQSLDYRQDIDRRALAKNAELEQRGILIHAEAIQDPSTAVLVRVRDGKISVTDGPYIETKEHMAGFALIEARDMAHSLAIAGEDPIAEFGTIEVRPVYEFPA